MGSNKKEKGRLGYGVQGAQEINLKVFLWLSTIFRPNSIYYVTYIFRIR